MKCRIFFPSMLVAAVMLVSLLFMEVPAGAAALSSQFLANDPAAALVMAGTPYDMNDPAWLSGGNQNRNTFAYKLFSGLLMLGYQTEMGYLYGLGDQHLRALKAFQAGNGLPPSNLVSSACLALMDQQLAQREQLLAPLAQGFVLKDHLQPLQGNDISNDTLATIYSLPMSVLPHHLQMTTYETIQCIAGQCNGFIQDAAGSALSSWPVPIDPTTDYRFVGAYFDPLKSNSRLPSAAVHVDTVLHEYAHYLDGFLYKNKDATLPKLGLIDTSGFHAISYDLAVSSSYGCYARRSADPQDWITKYGYNPGYGSCAAGSGVVAEEWAEAFSLYVAAGRDFRAAAQQSALIAQKYDWLKTNVFYGLEYDTDLPRGLESGCNDVHNTATAQPGYAHCNDAYIWNFTLPVDPNSLDSTPDPFTLASQTAVQPATVVVSNPIVINGINWSAQVSISGGEYSINGGGFVYAASAVYRGDTVRVRQVASGYFDTTTNATLNIGGVSDTFRVTTKSNLMPLISGTPPTSVPQGVSYTFTPTSSYSTSFTIANKPSWAAFDTASGTLSGIAATAGTFGNIIITAVNDNGTMALPPFSISVDPLPPAISGTPATSATAGVAYSFTPTATNATGFSISGTIPTGLNFNPASGTLSGTPSRPGVFGPIVISAVNGNLSSALPPFNITVTSSMGTISAGADLAAVRMFHTATLLANGKVLVAGGYDDFGMLSSAELYDPPTSSWTSAGAMSGTRGNHSATLLPDGRVLVTGGYSDNGITPGAELYDPATNSWSPAAPMAEARTDHGATLLPNGQVLVAGGYGVDGSILAGAERYNPSTNSWAPAGSMTEARGSFTTLLLADGTALAAGGYGNDDVLASAERFDPVSNSWSAAGVMSSARYYHSATLLPGGTVLLAGGYDFNSGSLASAELYDPAAQTWKSAGSLASARYAHTAVLLPNGKLLVAGGEGNNGTLDSMEMFDPAGETWSPAGTLTTPRSYHSATLLPNDTVLHAGGMSGYTTLSSSEIFELPKLTVTRSGAGSISCDSGALAWSGSTGRAYFASGTMVTLSAIPATGSSFSGWSGACSGSGACQIAMDSARSVTATFSTNQYVLSFSSSAGGSLSGSTSQTVSHGASSTAVTAIPTAGYHFVTWAGNNGFAVTTANPLILNDVSSSQTISAQFAADPVIPPPAKPGDLDDNGAVTIVDALRMLRIVVGLTVSTVQDMQRGDMNGNGSLDIGDALMILRKTVGL